MKAKASRDLWKRQQREGHYFDSRYVYHQQLKEKESEPLNMAIKTATKLFL